MLCDCKDDGFCSRYRREMGGRMRELCQGINVDLGTAAAFRDQWSREAGVHQYDGPPTPILLKTDQSPGDAVVMTAAIYSLHRAHPGRYVTAVESPWPEVFEHNPDVVAARADMAELRMHYPAIHDSNTRGIHFMQAWCEFLGAALCVSVPLLTNRPRLYFDAPAPPVEDFWLVCSGGKRDFTNKLWGHRNYQRTVDELTGLVNFVQVGSAEDDHQTLSGAYNLVGKTTLRQLFDLVRRARGVVCGVSLLMHVAAALEKPAIVIAGGREPTSWNCYPRQQYVHTVGALPCSDIAGNVGGACWRSRVVPLGDSVVLDKDTCLRPVDGTPTSLVETTVPECMTLIRPVEVADLIMRYHSQYEHNTYR